MFNDISCGKKTIKKIVWKKARLVSLQAKNLVKDNGHSLVLVPKRCCTLWQRTIHKDWDNPMEKMLIEFAESGCLFVRATIPLSWGQLRSKGHRKLSIHFGATQETIETVFRILVFANQLSLFGAIANMCGEFESLHDRSRQSDVVMGQSIVLGEIKAEIPLQNENPSHHQILWQQYEERIKSLSP